MPVIGDGYRELFDANPQPMWVYDRETLGFLAVNGAAITHYGYSRDDFLSMTLRDIRPPEDFPALESHLASVPDGVSYSAGWRHLKKDGTLIDVEVSGHPLEFAGRQARLVLVTDVTERGRVAAELAERDSMLRAIVDAELECVKLVAPGGRVLDMNPAGLAMIEADDLEQVKGKSIFPIVAESHREAFEALTESVFRGESGTLDFEIIGLKGTRRRLETHAVPLRDERGEIFAMLGLTRDITVRTLAEQSMQRAASLLQATLDSTADGILVVDSGGRISTFNRRFVEMWNIPQEVIDSRDDDEALAFVVGQLTDPDRFLSKVRELYAHPLEESFDVLDFKNGRVFERYSAPQLLEGEPVGRVWSFRDVTRPTQIERERRNAERKYRDLVERIPAVVYLAAYGEGAPWLYISPKVEPMLGFTPDEWIEDPALWLRSLHPEDRARVMEEENRSRDAGEPLASEYRFVASDGHVVWVRDEAEVVRDERGAPVALRGLWYDITDQKEAEVALRLSEELVRRLFGKLVDAQEEERARIAQDIHDDSIQVVTAVGLRLQTLRRGLIDPGSIEQVEKLQVTVEAAIARLRNLLFELRPRALDEEGLAAALRLYLDQVEKQSEIDCSVDNRLVDEPVPEIRTVLFRIAQEAIVNARKHANATKVDLLLEPRDGGFHVRVSDDGEGFDEGNGSGRSAPGHLGLSSIRERAEIANGWLKVESAPGRGTVVDFWLPEHA
jgi:PAS domain S-box-containing protein